ncbi:MAG: HAMP domain-containing sensor histidine kinase [Candidatus Neomarinimicrobiota bacterium]
MDSTAPIEDLLERFRISAAEVQAAYHQLEQELLTESQGPWEPAPPPTGLELPNLAPLYLMGTLVGGLSQSSLVINQDMEVISSNGEAKQDFKLEETNSLVDVLAPDSVDALQKLIDEATSHSGVEVRLASGASAGIYDCIYLDNPIEKGRLLLLVAHELELTQLRDVENQILKNLTGTLVHEIRTPLTSMQGFAELLLQVQNLDPKESDKLNMIKLGIERLNLLATALGTVFNEVVEPRWMKVGLRQFLQHTVERFCAEKSLPAKLIQLEDHQTDIEVVSDPELLRLALEQVFLNSVEAMENPKAGDIQVALRGNDKTALIAIGDNGPGPGDGDLSEWWVPFYTTKSGHLGLGLVQVRRIVEALGGGLEIKPRSPGGIDLEITLPV